MDLVRQELLDALHGALDNEEPLVLSPSGKPISFFCLLTGLEPEFVTLKNPIGPGLLPYVLSSSHYALHFRAFRLEASQLTPDGTELRFPFQPTSQKTPARQNARTQFFKDDHAFVRIEHPFDKGTVFTRPLYDYSGDGMSFRARRATPFLQPGRELPSCRVFIQGKFHAERAGRIVYVKQIVDLHGHSFFQVGVQFLDAARP